MSTHREDDEAAEDWDSELPASMAPSASATDMIADLAGSNKGVVTITPAGHKSRTRVPPVAVRVDWVYPGEEVELYTSYDDFQYPCVLQRVIDEQSSEEFFTGVLEVPPGRYLVRYKVDGEWLIDDNQEVVYSLGNEYNALTVKDPNAPEDDEEEDDEMDWDDIDDQLPEEFEAGADAAKELLNVIPASASGMVTISPAALLQAKNQMSQEEKNALLGVEAGSDHQRRPSLQWDSQRRAFVIDPAADQRERKHRSASPEDKGVEEAGGLSRSLTVPELRKQKDKERKKARRKRNKDNRRSQHGDAGFDMTRGRTTSSARAIPDITLIKDEVVKREREWREAWILHELKTQELREKEKATLRGQWKEEREQWITKIKHYATDNQQLRTQLNELQTLLERSQSEKELAESESKRRQDTIEQQNTMLSAELDKSKKESTASKEQIRVLRSEKDALQKDLDTSKAEASSHSSEAQSQQSHLKVALEGAQRELREVKEEFTRAKADFEQKLLDQSQNAQASAAARAEFDGKLQETTSQLNAKWSAEVKALKESESKLTTELQESQSKLAAARDEIKKAEVELKTRRGEFEVELTKIRDELSRQTQAIAQDSASVQSQLNARVASLTSELEAKDKALDKLRDEMKNVEKALSEATRVSGTLQKQLEAEQARAATAETKVAALEVQHETSSKQWSQRHEELTAQLGASGKTVEQKQQELNAAQSALAESKRNAQQLTSELEAAKADIASAKKDNEKSAENIKTLAARVESVSAERAKLEADSDKKSAEAEANISKLRSELLAAQQKLDSLNSDIEKLSSETKIKEANFAREKAALQSQVDQAKQDKNALLSRVNQVVAAAKALRENVDGFKDENIRQFGVLKNDFDDNKKFLLNTIGAQSQLLASTMKKYKKEMSERRKYFNLVQELRGNIRVFCRSRPMLKTDEAKGTKICAQFPEENTIVIKTDKRNNDYEFDRVFPPEAVNTVVFQDIRDLVTSCMDGYNVCIFAYGQTGSGKTFTMSGTSEDPGVNTRALTELFKIRDQRQGDYRYKISVNFLEIYNETVRDLLDTQTEKPLKIHKGPNGMYVENLAEWEVENEDDVHRAMETGSKNRATGVTNMNEHSSRSHSLLSVRVMGLNLTAGITYYGKLHLIDLAGSERISKSQATGQRLKEAQAINKSLSALGNVIESLQHKNGHVPYRDSKLTFLLQDSLGGHAKTLMFINVSPTEDDSEETFCSLNFAARVRKVELGSATRNVGGASAAAGAAAAPDSSSDYVTAEPSDSKDIDDDMVDDTAESAASKKAAPPAASSASVATRAGSAPVKAAGVAIKRVSSVAATPIKKPSVLPAKK